jgi:hypothetical protein
MTRWSRVLPNTSLPVFRPFGCFERSNAMEDFAAAAAAFCHREHFSCAILVQRYQTKTQSELTTIQKTRCNYQEQQQ